MSTTSPPGQLAGRAEEADGHRHSAKGSSFIPYRSSCADNPEDHDRTIRDIIRLREAEPRVRSQDTRNDPDVGQRSGGAQGGPERGIASQGTTFEPLGGHGSELRVAAPVSLSLSKDLSCSDHSLRHGCVSETMEQANSVKQLSKGMNRHLSQKTDSLLPDTIQSLALHERCVLLENACSQESLLSSTMHTITGSEKSAQRLSIWNHFDLSKNDGVRSILDRIDRERPYHIWLSMECSPYSVMQNINQRSPEQKAQLEQKRREVLKQYVGGAIIYQYCIQRGHHVTWEWPQTCQAWRLPLVQHLMQKYQLYFAITRGCQVNLRGQAGRFISKGWKLMSTSSHMAKRVDLPCTCQKETEHVGCEGSLTRKTAFYTPEFARRVCETILQGDAPQEIQKEFEGCFEGCDLFGRGLLRACEDGKRRDADLQCGSSQIKSYRNPRS